MSASKSKITSVTCPKCKQGFKFEWVPKMASVACPHCNAKIRLKRKKSKPKPTEQPSGIAQATDEKTSRLPVPDFFNDNKPSTDAVDSEPQVDEPQVNDSPKVKTSRRPREVNLDRSQSEESKSPSLSPSVQSPDAIDDELPEALAEPSKAIRPKPNIQVDLADDLLPPKFLVPDIEADANAVVLPTAGGGLQVIDKTEVRVMHEGQSVKLISLSPEELKRVRLIENLVALVIAAIMLAIAVWLVL